jgi:DNA transposition AAA+ family ATPase
MNDPSKQPIDIEEQRTWLIDHRAATGSSWSQIAGRMGIPAGTISQFGSANGYKGDNAKVAERIYRYRQTLMQQASIAIEAPDVPEYFDTQTSVELTHILTWAQSGRIVVAAMGPGLGKTKTARNFAACHSNVFLATMAPSTAGVANMQMEVLAALGHPDAVGTPQKLSRMIRDKVRDLRNPLIIIDEAQHLSEKAVEEIRSWHDAVRVGIALFGNVGVMQRLDGGARKAAFAQLYSRVSMKVVRQLPLQTDADALAIAWGVTSAAEIAQIRKVSAMPGGLRGATMMLELAWMIAASEKNPLGLDHMQDAWAQLSSRTIAA